MESWRPACAPPLKRWGSGMDTNEMMMKAATNTAIAMNSSGATSDMAVFEVTVPIRAPTKSGVSVPDSEFSAPPV